MSCETGVTAGVEFEKNMFGGCFATQDQKEGMEAFVEKRKPKFNGS
jgi:enoyl-CoA hydratase